MYAYVLLRGLAPEHRHVVKLVGADLSFSHAVCEFWHDGKHQALDTNGWHDLTGWRSLSDRFNAIYPTAHFVDEERLPYPFNEPRSP
jgi:hypothetical protein